MAHDGQESAGTFLLNSINNQEYTADHGCYTNLDSKKISRLVSRQDPVPDGIKQASLDSGVIRKTIEYFETEVIADMNPHLKDDTLEQLAVVVKSDTSVSTQKREYLLGLYKTSQYGRFMGEAFLYVVNRDNRRKKGADTIDYDDIPLLDEVNYECPLTHIKLVETVKGQPVKRYVITQIFPEGLSDELESAFIQVYDRPMDLNAPENLIALSEQRSADYLISPTVEEYKALYDLKRRLETAKKAANAIAATQLEDDIHTIINALITIADDEELIALEYDALHIEEKIQDRLLRPEIQFLAVRYYNFIEKAFSESEADFDLIATEIKAVSRKLEKSGISQQAVVSQLAEWIRNKTGLDENGTQACRIVVAFFVQNCEVFHK